MYSKDKYSAHQKPEKRKKFGNHFNNLIYLFLLI